MTRETLVHSLRALNEELKALKRASFAKGVAMLGAAQAADEFEEIGEADSSAERRRKAELIQTEREVLVRFQSRLQTIADGMAKDAVAWEAERSTYESVVSLLGSFDRLQGAAAIEPAHTNAVAIKRLPPLPPVVPFVAKPVEKVAVENGTIADPRAFTSETKFGVAGRAVLDARRAALDANDTDRGRYEQRLEATLAAFLEVIGDHPMNYYLPLHLQDFATVLGKVPTNRTKYPVFKGLSLAAMGAKNDALPEGKRIRRLSQTTVKEHITQIKLIWQKATAGVVGVRDIRSFDVTMPASAAAPIDREGLPIASLNKWLVDIVTPKIMRKPHKAWLPLVGYLTGMRLSEIVYLQSPDIVTIDGNEVFDLRLPLIINGKKVDRQLKTKTSVRVVAIHPLLHECGFIDFAKKQRGRGGFIFPHYHTSKDPADAAQKQMSNWMIALGIHEAQRQVFHSLRHNAKAWFRIHAGDGLADKQCGHAASSVGAKYGFKVLEPEEVEKIMAIPAPRGIDFTPLINWYQAP
ncbi:hypothetical protein PH547_07520 [Rhizobium sp. CNPSo 3464]|uniref:tyrosine-type recombinase/integrase n=1 Tax=Rhizobium sp. CNPSo 3464 TaxID=3021406 RepID=UPI002551C478|nr:hypothetical protein [Rhizobium sp. CNPSo 3464]MDK4738722.1 hypothetical protein [Rhizobium sp. CNPSo 3464]